MYKKIIFAFFSMASFAYGAASSYSFGKISSEKTEDVPKLTQEREAEILNYMCQLFKDKASLEDLYFRGPDVTEDYVRIYVMEKFYPYVAAFAECNKDGRIVEVNKVCYLFDENLAQVYRFVNNNIRYFIDVFLFIKNRSELNRSFEINMKVFNEECDTLKSIKADHKKYFTGFAEAAMEYMIIAKKDKLKMPKKFL